MKKSVFGLVVLFVLFTTYFPKINFIKSLNLNIKIIQIEGNSIVNSSDIKNKLSSLYNENLFFLNINNIQKSLKTEEFIESYTIKKIYPNTLKFNIIEKKPIAII